MSTLQIIKLSFAVALLTSCAHKPLTKAQMEAAYANEFAVHTACEEKYSAKMIREVKNLFGQVDKRFFAFTCGREKYACKSIYWNYQYVNSCTSKREYSSK
jgi:hypothetical protein